ncbi:M20 family metallopeptidase [Sphingobium phenoxybenzoativorans]|uniref:M20 family metallopeptidase n=1 Tax=Sphingobium phenoxybenzoativorans TaxID=1592790 RepID=UPI000B324D93|nr:M20/M25/M40 family metallo-hydrolase [Sphingobium phenoxybenzoativorans]
MSNDITRRSMMGSIAGGAMLPYATAIAAQVDGTPPVTFNSAKHKRLVDKIDQKGALAFLSKTVQHKSFTDTEGENDLAKFIAESMKADIPGIEAIAQPYEGRPNGKLKTRYNAIGVLKGTGGGKSIMFNGHIDTNPVTEGWTVDPFAGLVDKDFIYGIGVSNMKAGCAAYYWALKELVKAGVKLKGDVTLTFVSAELAGGLGTMAVLDGGYRADYFINPEPTDLIALTMHAIGSSLDIELIGSTRHMSKREEAVDTIMAACDLIPKLNAMTFRGALSAEHASINRVHVGVVHGALGRQLDEWRPPQVADYVKIKGSARYAPGQTHEGAMADIQLQLDALEKRFPGLKANNLAVDRKPDPIRQKGYFVSRDAPIVKAVNDAYMTVRRAPQPTGPETTNARYYGTDSPMLQNIGGMQGLVCGPGGRYNTMPDERVDIVDYIDMIKVFMLTIVNICGIES